MCSLSSSLRIISRRISDTSLLCSHGSGLVRPFSRMPSSSDGNPGTRLGLLNASAPYAFSFQNFIHTSGPKDFESESNPRTADFAGLKDFETARNSKMQDFAGWRNFEMGRNSKTIDFMRRITEQGGSQLPRYNPQQTSRNSKPMDFVRDILQQDGPQLSRYNLEQNADFVHIKLLRNNTHVNITDSKGKTKYWASSGRVPELKDMKGAQKQSRYTAEATAEYVGRKAREMGVKSVVVKVNGMTYFKKKRQAIMSFREGISGSRGGHSPIVYIEDTTRRPHNGCRLPKKRRI